MPIINVLKTHGDVLQVFGLSDHTYGDINGEKQQILENMWSK